MQICLSEFTCALIAIARWLQLSSIPYSACDSNYSSFTDAAAVTGVESHRLLVFWLSRLGTFIDGEVARARIFRQLVPFSFSFQRV